jgi:hypothetical protein
MYCPVCRVENRKGFTICADCNVALVPELPNSEGDVPPETGLRHFYEGVDENEFARITAALEAAGIHFQEAAQFGGLMYIPLMVPRYRIWVAPEDHDRANIILAEVLIAVPDEFEESMPDGVDNKRPAEEVREWYPELATAEFWTGNNADFAKFLAATLLENGIHSKLDEADKTVLRLMIYPEHEERAREILQEIQKGEPTE